MRSLLVVAFALGLAAECTRAPAEDFASRPSGTPPGPSTGSSAASPAGGQAVPVAVAVASSPPQRCMLPTPAQPPPPVAPAPASACPPDPESNQKVRVVHVTFTDSPATVEAEFVASHHDTERGLMYRRSMPEDRGMLFDLKARDEHPFWMHNTCIPLDLLYVDDDGFVAGIVENAPTLDDTPRDVGCPSRYVLEVNAGWSRRHGVKAGLHMVVPR